ncbi:hypothetical protein U1Q18_052449 [Sarracenia purpurea var. burkii]
MGDLQICSYFGSLTLDSRSSFSDLFRVVGLDFCSRASLPQCISGRNISLAGHVVCIFSWILFWCVVYMGLLELVFVAVSSGSPQSSSYTLIYIINTIFFLLIKKKKKVHPAGIWKLKFSLLVQVLAQRVLSQLFGFKPL